MGHGQRTPGDGSNCRPKAQEPRVVETSPATHHPKTTARGDVCCVWVTNDREVYNPQMRLNMLTEQGKQRSLFQGLQTSQVVRLATMHDHQEWTEASYKGVCYCT